MKMYVGAHFLAACLLVLLGSSAGNAEELDMFKASELPAVLAEEKYVVVLINREEVCSGACRALEERLLAIRAELAEAVGAWVVRSDTAKWDLPDNTIVFVRAGAPLVHTPAEGDSSDDTLDALLAGTKSRVLALNDETFEHDTQATSGATTGDWLLVFGRDGCGAACEGAQPAVEGAALRLHRTMSVARLERDVDAPLTTRRLGVTAFPSAVLIRQGKLYRFEGAFTVEALEQFATGGYEEVEAEDIPRAKGRFDDAAQEAMDWARENPGSLACGVLGTLAFIGFVVLLNLPMAKHVDRWSSAKKKKSKKSN